MDANTQTQPDSIRRKTQVIERLGFSKSTLQRMIAAGTFPKPIQLSPRIVGWRESTIEVYLAARAAVTEADTVARSASARAMRSGGAK